MNLADIELVGGNHPAYHLEFLLTLYMSLTHIIIKLAL